MANNDYVLRGGAAGAERLRLLARVKWPTTETFFRRIGLRPGMRCLDLGCGIGMVTVRLAEWTGQAVGIDADAEAIDIARAETARAGVPAQFHAGAIAELADAAAYDLVYARFLLTHLADPAVAVASMRRAARPGGLVAVEDIDFGGHFSYPPCPAFERYVELYQAVVRSRGGDPCIGPRLFGLFLAAGLKDVRLEVVQPTFQEGEGKRVAAVTLEHIREAVVQASLADDAEIDRLLAELEDFARDERTLLSLPRVFQVCGVAGNS